jgi:hypothetical protein
MKKLVVVCLGVLLFVPAAWGSADKSEAFEPARRIGESNTPSFFLFSTSAGNYIIRHDGMGEVERGGMRRVFYLKIGGKNRLECVYFCEHDGDLFLLYEVSGQQFYLLRMEQKKRKPRWLAPLPGISETSVINGDRVIVGSTVVSKIDGRIVRPDQD